jgi:hypothetical protein
MSAEPVNGGKEENLPCFVGITQSDNYENLFILWFRLDFRVFNFIMVRNFLTFE